MSAPAPGPASPPSTPPKPAVPAAQPAGAPPTTVVPAPAQGTPPQAAPVAQQPTPSPTPAPAIPQAKPAVPAAQPAPAAAAPAAAQQPPPASQPAAAQTPAAIPQAKPAVPQAAPSAAPAAAAPASPPQAQPAPGGIPQAKPAVPQPPAAAPAATAAAVPQAKPAVPAAQPAPAAAAPTPAQQPPPATPAPSTPAPAAPAGVVPQAKPAVPQAKPAAPPAAKPADTAVARSDTAASGKDDAPKEEAGPAKVETSLLDKFIADETWEKNEILKWMGPWLQQVERGIMLFGSGAFAWLLGRTGWSFAWVMFVFLATVPAWDRSLKVAFQRMKALARYEVLHSRLETDWESMDWFNYFFQKFWYQLEPDISKTAIQAVNTQLEAFKPSFISSLVLSEFTLGSQPPVIKAVKSFPRVSGDDRAQVMFHVEWTPLTQEDLIAERVRQERIRSAIKTQAEQDGGGFSKDMQNSKIVLMAYVGAGAAKVGVPVELKNVALEGQFIVRFKFGPQVPYIQTVNAWFPDEYGPPAIDFELQPLKSVNVLDVPLLSGAIQNAIKGTLESMLKYPGYKVDLTGLAAPPTDAAEWAAGVLRMTIISARNLPNVDMFSGASDPYCKILMGVTGAEKVLGQTRIIKDNANPLWNESTYALVPNSVLSAEGISTGADNIRFEVMDWNDKSAHEFIGITKKMRIAEFIRSGKAGSLPEDRKKEMAASWGTPDSLSPVWQPLTKRDDVRALRGDLQIDMCWAVAEALDEKNKDTKSGIVRVTIHQAAELVAFGGIANFTPYISFQVGGKEVFRTPKKKSTINPSYTQTFEVYYHDISQSSITAIVKHGADFRDDPTIGDATIKISDAIARKPGDDWFKLFNTSSGRLRMAFKFLPVRWPDNVSGATMCDPVIAGKEDTEVDATGEKPVRPPLPDVIDEAKLNELGFKWVAAANGQIPALAIEGGSAGLKSFQALYVARVHYGGGIYAGKASLQLGGTNFGANGDERVSKEYEVLVASDQQAMKRIRWIRVSSTAELRHCVGMVSGGLRDATGSTMIVARKYFRNGMHVGNTSKTAPGISFSWGGKERVESADFEVMVIE